MLSFKEKKDILNSFQELIEVPISYDRYNYKLLSAKGRRKNVAGELGPNNCGYLYVGYLEEFKNIRDSRGFINLDHFSSSELRKTIKRVIASFK